MQASWRRTPVVIAARLPMRSIGLHPSGRRRQAAKFLAGLDDEDLDANRKPPKVISPSDPCSAWTAKANKRVQLARADRGARRPLQASGILRQPRVRGGRWPGELSTKPHRNLIGWPAFTPVTSPKGAKPADFLSFSRPSSSSSSTCKRPGRSASKSRRLCSPAPTR